MALSLTMDFAPCSNALRFTALCVHFVLFTMGFTRPCAKQRGKKTHGSQDYVSDASKCFQQTMILYPGKHITSHHNVFAAPPQTQPHLWRKITTCLTSHHNVIAAPPQTQPHDHVHRIKMHEFPGAVLDDVSKNKPHVFSAYFFSKAPEKTEFDVVLKEVPKDGQAASGALVRKSPDWAYPI